MIPFSYRILFLFVTLGFLGACVPKETHYVFRPLSVYTVSAPAESQDSAGTWHTDSMFMNIVFAGENIKVGSRYSLVSSLYAVPIIYIPKWETPLASLKITSNQAFNGIAAGEDIQSKCWGLTVSKQKISVDSLLSPLIREAFDPNSPPSRPLMLQFKEKPLIAQQEITVTFTLKNEQVLVSEPVLYQWN